MVMSLKSIIAKGGKVTTSKRLIFMRPVHKKLVSVNIDACKQIVQWLRSHRIPPEEEETKLLDIPSNLVGNLYFFLVAICHQTSPPGEQPLEGTVCGTYRRGWDYLLWKFEVACENDLSLLEPTRWADFSAQQMRDIFRDSNLGLDHGIGHL